jgi:hypothetical protein
VLKLVYELRYGFLLNDDFCEIDVAFDGDGP